MRSGQAATFGNRALMGSAIASFNAGETRSALTYLSSFKGGTRGFDHHRDTYNNFHEVAGLPGGLVLPNHFGNVSLRTLANLRTAMDKGDEDY